VRVTGRQAGEYLLMTVLVALTIWWAYAMLRLGQP
jgi:hypothetical protein